MKRNICNVFLDGKNLIFSVLLFIFCSFAIISYINATLVFEQVFYSFLIFLGVVYLVFNGSYMFLQKVEYDGDEFSCYPRILLIITFYLISIYFLFNWD